MRVGVRLVYYKVITNNVERRLAYHYRWILQEYFIATTQGANWILSPHLGSLKLMPNSYQIFIAKKFANLCLTCVHRNHALATEPQSSQGKTKQFSVNFVAISSLNLLGAICKLPGLGSLLVQGALAPQLWPRLWDRSKVRRYLL